MVLKFFDDFDGQTLDLDKWTAADGKQGYGLETFCAENVVLQDGILRLRCDGNFNTAEISTVGKFDFRYGWAECRARVPKGVGFWPAFWTLTSKVPQDTWQEIDILEDVGLRPERTYFNAHWGPRPGTIEHYRSSYGRYDWDFSAGYHRYAVDWMPGRVDFYVDNFLASTLLTDQLFDRHHLLLSFSLSKAGSFGGSPDSLYPYPAWFEIDYVGVWQDEKHRRKV